MKLALGLVFAALVAPVKGESMLMCQYPGACGRGAFKTDVCRSMGEQEHDKGLVTKWQNLTCLADAYVSCSRVEFGALNGHHLRVSLQYDASAISPTLANRDTMNAQFYSDQDTSCYQLTSQDVTGGWPGAIYPDPQSGEHLNASQALSVVKFKVECNDMGQDDDETRYDDDLAGFCEYTAFLRCDCRQRSGTPLPTTTDAPQCSNMLNQSQCNTGQQHGYHDVCDIQKSTHTYKQYLYQARCPMGQVVDFERLQFKSTLGLIDVDASAPFDPSSAGNLSDLIRGQNLSCLVACPPDAADKGENDKNIKENSECISYPQPSNPRERDKLRHLPSIEFAVSCASDSCGFETFLRYKCIEAPPASVYPTQYPTATPAPTKHGDKTTSAKSLMLIAVTIVVLVIIGAIVVFISYHKRNGYMRHGDAEDEGTIAMAGFDLDDDPTLRLGARRPETNIVITGTDDDAVWRPDPVTGKPTQGPGTPQPNRKAVSNPGSMPRRFDPQTGAPLDESVSPTSLHLWPSGNQGNDGHVDGVVSAGADNELLITLSEDIEASSSAVGTDAGHLDALLFGTPASDRFFTPMEGATPTSFATPGTTPFATPFATPGQPLPDSTPNRRFDPHAGTGQPLVSDASPPIRPMAGPLPRRFDTNTGLALSAASPLVEMAQVSSVPAPRFNPQTGQPY